MSENRNSDSNFLEPNMTSNSLYCLTNSPKANILKVVNPHIGETENGKFLLL